MDRVNLVDIMVRMRFANAGKERRRQESTIRKPAPQLVDEDRNALLAGSLFDEPNDRLDLWTGMSTSPVAITLRDKANFLDLTGLARLRWMVRTQALHVAHPVVKLADGTMLVGSYTQSNDGEYIQSEVAFGGQHWYKLDPVKVVTTVEVKNPDLSKVDEVGVADLMPSGGHGNAGWINLSGVELYARSVPR